VSERDVDTYRFGTVTAVGPLQVRLDGDSAPVSVAPVPLCQCAINDRVYCQLHGRQLVVLGVVYVPGLYDTWTDAALLNAWTNYGGSYQIAAFRRDAAVGSAELTGLIKHATGTQTGVLMNLPLAVRPTRVHIFITQSYVGQARVDVSTDGNVTCYAYYNGGNANWISLSQIRWPIDAT
jgi:hypothetical protein